MTKEIADTTILSITMEIADTTILSPGVGLNTDTCLSACMLSGKDLHAVLVAMANGVVHSGKSKNIERARDK